MRFAFGKNWRSFLSALDEKRIEEATEAIRKSTGVDDFHGLRVLDVGSGSGLSSLAFYNLGAEVVSFDYDLESVACTAYLQQKFAADKERWHVMQGSAIDPKFIASLGQFDLVYSWGVLHHTGEMWRALELTQAAVLPGGMLLIALYNNQGLRSRMWWHIKRFYCSGRIGRSLVGFIFYPLFAAYALVLDISKLQMLGSHMREYFHSRGMSIVHDWRDWLGGFPFEVADPKDVIEKLHHFGFATHAQSLTKGWGCNEFVLTKVSQSDGI